MSHWWVTDALKAGGPAYLSAWVIWVVVSITLHELAHGWAAISRGDSTPIDTGHMTWNPLVHMGGMSLLVFAVTGIAWGLMPVTPSRMRGRHADAFVAVCGPLMNVALAAVCIVGTVVAVLALSGTTPTAQNAELLKSFRIFFGVGCSLNVTLALFNLIPAPPLDGSRILADFSHQYRSVLRSESGQFFGIAMFIVAFFFAGRLIGGVGIEAWIRGAGGMLDALHAIGVGPGSPWSGMRP